MSPPPPHKTIPQPSSFDDSAPLKRYGNYPPEPAPAPNQADSAAGGADASSLEPALGHEDGEVNYSEDGAVGKPGEGLPCRAKCPPGGTEAGGQGGEARGAGSLEGLRLPKMSCRVSKTSEGFTDLLATVEVMIVPCYMM